MHRRAMPCATAMGKGKSLSTAYAGEKASHRIRRTGRTEGRDAERERIRLLLREPSADLVKFVAVAIRDSQLGPARAAIGAICDWIASGSAGTPAAVKETRGEAAGDDKSATVRADDKRK